MRIIVIPKTSFLLTFIFLTLFMTGCITSPPSKFYMLTPTIYKADKDVAKFRGVAFDKNLTLGVGPVTIPKYLDRSQLVVRKTPNQISLEEFNLWAGSPRDDIPAIILENLSNIFGTGNIYKYPWQRDINIDYQIVLDILQLDGAPEQSVKIIAKWEIISKKTIKTSKTGRADIVEHVTNSSLESIEELEQLKNSDKLSVNQFDSFVLAQSRALGKLSLLIANALIDSL